MNEGSQAGSLVLEDLGEEAERLSLQSVRDNCHGTKSCRPGFPTGTSRGPIASSPDTHTERQPAYLSTYLPTRPPAQPKGLPQGR